MNDKEYCLKELVEKVENDERILHFRFQYKDTLVWPFIRFSIYRLISSKQFNYLKTYEGLNRTTPIRTCLHEFIKCIRIGFNIPLFWERKDILYFSYTSHNVVCSDGKKNRVYGGFISEYRERSGVIETLGNDKYKKVTRDTRYLDPVDFWVEAFSYLSRSSKKDIAMADSVVSYLCNECKLDFSKEERIGIKKNILIHSKRIRYLDKVFPIMFRKIAPKIVFIEMGHYGDKKAYLIKILHDMGIKVADIQHGLVSKNHDAYYCSDFLCNNSEYALYSPDFFLGWGEYWLSKISIPGEKVAVGNPFFWQQYDSIIKQAELQKKRKRKIILWLAFDDNDKNMAFLDKFICISHNAYYIRVRLHPVLQGLKTAYKKYEKNDKIILDESQTVYDAFSKADYVISESSTAIYEALAVGKTVFVLESELSKCFETAEVVSCFRSPEELFVLLTKGEGDGRNKENIADVFFGKMWQLKFRQFMETLGIK